MRRAGEGGRASAAVVAAVLALAAAPAHAAAAPSASDERATRWWNEIARRLEAAVTPLPTPPVPVNVSWSSRRLAAVDLGAPLVALAIRDLDGDARGELVALTTRELLVLRRSGRRAIDVVARAALPEQPARLRARDAVGTLVITGGRVGALEVHARTSEQEHGARWVFRDGALQRVGLLDGFPICGGAAVGLHGGRNYFAAASLAWGAAFASPLLPETFYDARCAEELIDAQGAPYAELAVAGADGTLTVQRLVRCDGERCPGAAAPVDRVEVRNRGVAFAIADVDNDGDAEVLATTNRAPGRGDQVSVYTRDGDGLRRVARSKKFTGGVAALAAGDLDADGDRDVVAAVRLVGSNKVDLWLLTR